jgi:histidine ammonia-lyase
MTSEKHYLNLSHFKSIVYKKESVHIEESVLDKVKRSFSFLESFSENKILYGVNTGFGPMAQYRVPDADRALLQYNLIRSHANGAGLPLSPEYARAAVLARLNTLSLGHSGVHPSVLELMKELLNRDIIPLIFEHGGVGASGDLVQLAHLALVLIGEGEVFHKGVRRPTAEVFQEQGLHSIDVKIREGLALINGTSVMSGIGIVNLYRAEALLDWSIRLSCAINELMRAYDDHLSKELNETKLHPGQREVAEKMRAYLSDSHLTRKRQEHLYSGENKESVFKEKVQEYYSIRCVPQILGPVADTLKYVGTVLENEINSANDNPVVDMETEHVYHGGNFHGDYISLEMDKLKIVVTKLTMLAERQLNYLLNPALNGILPPFVNLATLGFNFGMQGLQFTATSTTAESQTLSNPMYVHSIPNNNDNQDIVSMGTNAAVLAGKVIENAFQVLSIEAITVCQAIDALQVHDKISSSTKDLYDRIRSIVPVYKEDRPMYKAIEDVKNVLLNGY